MPGPIVEVGESVVLRTVERGDAAFIQRLYTDPWARVGVHASGHKSEGEVEEVIEEEFEADENAAYLACVDSDVDGQAASEAPTGDDADAAAPFGHPVEDETTSIGVVFVSHVERDRPRIVHWIAPEHRGDGYGEQALELAVDTVFRTYDVHSLAAAALEGDDARRERLEALGFVHEGANREMRFVEGAYRDAHQYGLLREEWEAE